MKQAIVCDLDGTLALFGNENPFNRDFLKDKINEPVAAIIRNFWNGEDLFADIIICSGRSEEYRDQTIIWLTRNQIPYSDLLMRPTGDKRMDAIIKQEFLFNEILPEYEVLFAIDDRKQVKQMWVNHGIFVLDVNQHDIDF